MDCQKVDKQWKKWRMRLKLRDLHELPSKEIVKSGTIRLTSDCRKAMEEERCPTIRKELDKCNTRLQFLADCLHFTPSGTVLKGQCHEKKKKLCLSGWVVALGLNKRPWILCKKVYETSGTTYDFLDIFCSDSDVIFEMHHWASACIISIII